MYCVMLGVTSLIDQVEDRIENCVKKIGRKRTGICFGKVPVLIDKAAKLACQRTLCEDQVRWK